MILIHFGHYIPLHIHVLVTVGNMMMDQIKFVSPVIILGYFYIFLLIKFLVLHAMCMILIALVVMIQIHLEIIHHINVHAQTNIMIIQLNFVITAIFLGFFLKQKL